MVKNLIYEVFSGVGLANQTFSLEMAIYLAYKSNRKLILLIRHPLCHCGKSLWEFGYVLNYFNDEFTKFLPHGYDVYYGNIPSEITSIINNPDLTRKITYNRVFAQCVFVDPELDTPENQNEIREFCRWRNKTYLGFDEKTEDEYIYLHESNASRSLFNFYTTSENYKIIYEVCKSFQIKKEFYDIAENVYNSLNVKHSIFLHMRFGDRHESMDFLTINNETIFSQLPKFLDSVVTDDSKIYVLCDNRKNTAFLEKFKDYNITLIDDITNNPDILSGHNIEKVSDNSVNYAIIDMLLAARADEFVGSITSTFTHYIQFLRYTQQKSFYNYSNIKRPNNNLCRFTPVNNSNYPWKAYEYMDGHPISWHMFWDIDSFYNSR